MLFQSLVISLTVALGVLAQGHGNNHGGEQHPSQGHGDNNHGHNNNNHGGHDDGHHGGRDNNHHDTHNNDHHIGRDNNHHNMGRDNGHRGPEFIRKGDGRGRDIYRCPRENIVCSNKKWHGKWADHKKRCWIADGPKKGWCYSFGKSGCHYHNEFDIYSC